MSVARGGSTAKVVDLNEVKRNKRRKQIEAQYVAFYGNTWALAAK